MKLKNFGDFLFERNDKKVNHIEKMELPKTNDEDLEKEIESFMHDNKTACPRCGENYEECCCADEDPWSTHVYHRAKKIPEKYHLNTYREFVNEAKKAESPVKIVILSNMSSKSYTIPALEKELNKKGIPNAVIDINTASLKFSNDNSGDIFISDSKTKPFKINSENTAILTRRGIVKNTNTRELVSKLEDNNFFVVNSLDSVMACENKFTTSKILRDHGIPIPKMALIQNEDGIEPAVKEIGGKFPVVLKLLSGSQGIGVSIIDSIESLKSVLQTLWKVEPGIEVMIQEKIESDYDLRVHVLTRKFNSPSPSEEDAVLLGYMRRNKIDNDFRTNHSLGGTVEKTSVTPEQEDISIKSARAIGCNWCGVDIIVDKKTGKNYVLEVNASPGTQGLKKATGINVISDIINFLIDKSNWVRSRKIVGFRELIKIPGIASVVAKFDTGNGAASCSMTYDTLKINDKKQMVEWTIGDHKFKNKIVGYSNPMVGDEVHERPIISLDVEFAGKLYTDVSVSLVDRVDKSTKFLINRKFMERIGCSVNPSKTFIITEMPSDYSISDSKGNPYGGIKFEK